jgi:hypothetical protein
MVSGRPDEDVVPATDHASGVADYREEARRAAARYGLDPGVFERQIQQESGFNPTIRSPAGAVGIAQIMPATARGWGVDPLNPTAALDAAAKNMAAYVKKYGGIENALRAYNAGPGAIKASHGYAETNAYVKRILGGQAPAGVARPRSVAPVPAPATGAPTDPSSSAPTSFSGGQAGDFTSLLQSMLTRPQARPEPMPIAPPSFAAAPPMPQGFQPAASVSAAPSQRGGGVEGALSLVSAIGGAPPSAGSPEPKSTAEAVIERRKNPGVVGAVQRRRGSKGSFQISGPDPGRLKPGLTSFAEQVAAVYGGSLTGLDGSTHPKFTVNGNVSEHWSGNATDIFRIDGKPAVGERLIRAGQAALIAAGANRKWALKQRGGLYNIGNHQIIFNTSGVQNGGDHTDHLHISTHAKSR